MSLPKFHKLYFPGLISVAILPVLFVLNIFNGMLAQKSFGINVASGNDSMFRYWTKVQNRSFNPYTFRKFSNNVLTDDKRNNNFVLKNLENNIRSLAISTDTIKGYTISFTAHTTYETIINAIDVCARYEKNENYGIHFILYKDRLLIWEGQSYQPKPPPKISL
jgi:hypothetical protein